jgi:hypothetical protein
MILLQIAQRSVVLLAQSLTRNKVVWHDNAMLRWAQINKCILDQISWHPQLSAISIEITL